MTLLDKLMVDSIYNTWYNKFDFLPKTEEGKEEESVHKSLRRPARVIDDEHYLHRRRD